MNAIAPVAVPAALRLPGALDDFPSFKRLIEAEFFLHPVVRSNAYTRWFSRGLASEAQARDLLVQFSVFSNHFLVMQVRRMVNAASLEAERGARHILMNECGVAIDPRTGSAEGKTFSTANAHLNWLREAAAALGLGPLDLGRWELGARSTRSFLRGLERTYGSADPMIGAGASFAVETWAAFGIGGGAELESRNFWSELIAGLEGFNARRLAGGLEPVPLGFFKYHFQLESGHGAAVWRELEETFAEPGFDPERWLEGGRRALKAIHAFWLGLESRRRRLQARSLGSDSAERARF